MEEERVILVNEQDEVLGTMAKLEAHRTGTLHRAFSIFVFHEDGRLLLQKRATNKYHSAGLWTNTCCSHPRPGEDLQTAAARRLNEEMGIEASLVKRFAFTYHADVGDGLTEHEYDHVFFGTWSGQASPNPVEVEECAFMETDVLEENLARHPDRYTIWLRECWPLVKAALSRRATTAHT